MTDQEKIDQLTAEVAVLRGAIKVAAEGPGQDWLQLQLMLCNVLTDMDKGIIGKKAEAMVEILEAATALDNLVLLGSYNQKEWNEVYRPLLAKTRSYRRKYQEVE